MNRNSMTLIQMAEELTRRAENKRDFIVDTRELGFHSADREAFLSVPRAGDFRISDHAHGQIAERLGIPKRYYDRLRVEAPALLETNVRHWFENAADRRMVRTQDSRARAFLSDRYHRIDHEQIAEAVLPVLLEAVGHAAVVSCAVTDWKLSIQAVFPRREGEVTPGDVVQAGVLVSNGEIGNGALEIIPLIYRLVCANGLIVGERVNEARFRRHHVGRRMEADEDYALCTDDTRVAEDRALRRQVRDAIQTLAQPALFAQRLAALRQATQGPPLANPTAAVAALGQAYHLSQDERQAVLTHVLRGADYSRWGLINAVTATANDHASYDRAIALQALGGTLLGLSREQWRPIAMAEARPVAA